MRHPLEKERAEAVRAVRLAARLCAAVRSGISPDVMDKKDKSPVTVADFGSQALICRALASTFPEDPIVAEEDAAELRAPNNAPILEQVAGHIRRILLDDSTPEDVCRWIDLGGTSRYSDRFWTLDPIDGTKGFLRGEKYAVALALIVGGRVVVAALACPNLKMTPGDKPEFGTPGVIFSALRGQGTRIEPLDDRGVGVAPIHVSIREKPSEARFCESVESGHSAHGDSAAIAKSLGILLPPVRMDSQAKYGVVARGEAEIYLRMPTRADYREKIWDHAAGSLIVEESGGTVTDITGRPLEFHHGRELSANRGVIVSNGRLHEAILDALRGLGLAG